MTTPEAVVNYIRKEIRIGTFSPGEELPSERIMTEKLGISRLSLREGLARLSALGIIQVRHGKGAVISTDINPESLSGALLPLMKAGDRKRMRDLFETRLALECESSSLAAERRTEEDIDRLDRTLSVMAESCEDPEGYGKIDKKFHLQIGETSRNDLLQRMLEVLGKEALAYILPAFTEEERRKALEDHRAILEAIREGDPGGARKAMRHSLERGIEHFETYSEARQGQEEI